MNGGFRKCEQQPATFNPYHWQTPGHGSLGYAECRGYHCECGEHFDANELADNPVEELKLQWEVHRVQEAAILN